MYCRTYTVIFQGKMLHTHDYKQPSGYEDKRIVVIGIGNSAGDAAVELARCAKQVRRGLFTPSITDIERETDINPQIW